MRYQHRRNYDSKSHDASEHPCSSFWGIQILGGILIFLWGMRFAVKRTPLLPIVLYRFFRGMASR